MEGGEVSPANSSLLHSPLPTSWHLTVKWGWQDESFILNTADIQPTSCHSINKGREYKLENRATKGGFLSIIIDMFIDKVGSLSWTKKFTNRPYNSSLFYFRFRKRLTGHFVLKAVIALGPGVRGLRNARSIYLCLIYYNQLAKSCIVGVQIWATLSIPTARENTES